MDNNLCKKKKHLSRIFDIAERTSCVDRGKNISKKYVFRFFSRILQMLSGTETFMSALCDYSVLKKYGST